METPERQELSMSELFSDTQAFSRPNRMCSLGWLNEMKNERTRLLHLAKRINSEVMCPEIRIHRLCRSPV